MNPRISRRFSQRFKLTLIDTSVWIEHLRQPVEELILLLKNHRAMAHPAVIGELACGHLPKRNEFLADIALLPRVKEAEPADTHRLIETRMLFGKGLGWVDMQLLSSVLIADVGLLTFDKKLHDAFFRLSKA